MRAVVQRVAECAVRVDGEVRGRIAAGLLVYLGVSTSDSEDDLRYIAEKIVNLRIFTDAEGKMNLSVRETGGAVLMVSQFTLYGDARRGRRPSYTAAADLQTARRYYELAAQEVRARGVPVQTGVFAARMEVEYTNVGPVTILLDSERRF